MTTGGSDVSCVISEDSVATSSDYVEAVGKTRKVSVYANSTMEELHEDQGSDDDILVLMHNWARFDPSSKRNARKWSNSSKMYLTQPMLAGEV